MDRKKRWRRPRIIKIGNVVESLALPVARLIDSVLNTDIQNCEACKKRRDRWNEN
jgi:hypothetical protein